MGAKQAAYLGTIRTGCAKIPFIGLFFGLFFMPLAGHETMAETVLRAVSALPANVDQTRSFLKFFVEPANERLAGSVRIQFLGGPEVIPPRKSAQALKRGVIDLLYAPPAYYAGIVPESRAPVAANRPLQEMRANGAIALLDQIWQEKLNAKFLAWGESSTRFHVYLTDPPRITEKGFTLKGLRMRSTETYNAMFTALDAIPVNMSAGDIYTGLSRGVVDGFGWTDIGLISLGLTKSAKYRVDPPFYRGTVFVIVNLGKWNGMSRQNQQILEEIALNYEQDSAEFLHGEMEKQLQILTTAGMKIVTLEPAVARQYLRTAYEAMWAELDDRSEHAAVLRKKMYKALP